MPEGFGTRIGGSQPDFPAIRQSGDRLLLLGRVDCGDPASELIGIKPGVGKREHFVDKAESMWCLQDVGQTVNLHRASPLTLDSFVRCVDPDRNLLFLRQQAGILHELNKEFFVLPLGDVGNHSPAISRIHQSFLPSELILVQLQLERRVAVFVKGFQHVVLVLIISDIIPVGTDSAGRICVDPQLHMIFAAATIIVVGFTRIPVRIGTIDG